MKILCSRCGNTHSFRYSAENVGAAVYEMGWGSYGSALYCPECSKTWDERNKGRYYHNHVVPEMVCPKCGKSALDLGTDYRPLTTKYSEGMQV